MRTLPRAERGLSLVELMVSITIGLLVVIVIANLFIGSRASYRALDDSARIQENSRYAFQVIGRAARVAGYRADFTKTTDQIFTSSGAPVSVVLATDGGGSASDTLTFRFTGSGGLPTSTINCATSGTCTDADGNSLDCQGRRINGVTVSVNTFAIRTGANGGPALFCTIDAGTNWVEIVPDIENMQVNFGEPSATDLSVNRYLPATTATMTNVLAMRIALLHRAPQVSSATPASKSYNLLGTTVGPFTDSRSRLVTTTTMVLRNRAP